MTITSARRNARLQELYGNTVPRLWCPPLTHFSAPRRPDEVRSRVHLRWLSRWVGGLLVPGSTGEAWQMDDDLVVEVLRITFQAIESTNMRILIGVLKPDLESTYEALGRLKPFLSHPRFGGITVCPFKSVGQDQRALRAGLEQVLQLGLPTAVYQLPQVTGNEVSPETLSALADAHENLLLFKDTSGTDLVAKSRIDLGGVFLLRGSEQGGYSQWTKHAGGLYDGFLLSTANAFAGTLDQIFCLQSQGLAGEASQLSERLSTIVGKVFRMVSELDYGNPFTNANKLFDHVFAYGSEARNNLPPMLIDGTRLPFEMLDKTISLLQEHGFYCQTGYLQTQ